MLKYRRNDRHRMAPGQPWSVETARSRSRCPSQAQGRTESRRELESDGAARPLSSPESQLLRLRAGTTAYRVIRL